MLFGGEALLNKAYRNYPNQLSLLVYHGTEDKVDVFQCMFSCGNVLT